MVAQVDDVRLTPRELEALQCVCRGKSNKGIATEMGVAHATVKNFLGHIYRKLGVGSRVAAVFQAWERGLLNFGLSQSVPVREVRVTVLAVTPEPEADIIRVAQLELSAAGDYVRVAGHFVAVRHRELGILVTLLRRPQHIYSRDELLDAVWGTAVVVESRAVDVHIGRLRRALAPYGYADLVETVRGCGYRARLPATAVGPA